MPVRRKRRRLDFIKRQMPVLVALLAISAVMYFLHRSQTDAIRRERDRKHQAAAADENEKVISVPAAASPVAAEATVVVDPTKEFLAAAAPGGPEETAPAVLTDPTRQLLAETEADAKDSPAVAELELDLRLQTEIPFPVIKPLEEIVDGWRGVPPKAFPPEVHLKSGLTYVTHAGGKAAGKGSLASGAAVIPVALEGDRLTVAPSRESSERMVVPVDDTDFKALVKQRYDNFVLHSRESVLARRAAEKRRILNAQTKELALSHYGDGKDPRFDPMKQSLRSGGAGMYQIEAAESWRWSGKETVDGVEYDTGMVMMVSESAFGSTKREIKALLQDGKIVRWVDAATGKAL